MGFTRVNAVYGTVATQSNAASTSVVLGTGQGAAFASATTASPIRCAVIDTTTNPETLKFFLNVTGRATDTLTVANRGVTDGNVSSADANILVGYVVAAVTSVGVLDATYVQWAPAPSGGDDTSALQAILDSLNTAGGGTLNLQAGHYKVTTLYPKSNVYIRGQGMGATIIEGTGAAATNVIQFGKNTYTESGSTGNYTVSYTGILGCTVFKTVGTSAGRSGAAPGASGIVFAGASYFICEENEVYQYNACGIMVVGVNNSHGIIRRNYGHDGFADAICCFGGVDIDMSNNVVYNVGDTGMSANEYGTATNAWGAPVTDVRIMHNWISNIGDAGVANQGGTRVMICDNYIEEPHNAGVRVDYDLAEGYNGVTGTVVDGNIIIHGGSGSGASTGSQTGFYQAGIECSGGVQQVTISRNKIYNPGYNYVAVVGTGHSEISIIDNECYGGIATGNGGAHAPQAAGIYVGGCLNPRVARNRIVLPGGPGVYIDTTCLGRVRVVDNETTYATGTTGYTLNGGSVVVVGNDATGKSLTSAVTLGAGATSLTNANNSFSTAPTVEDYFDRANPTSPGIADTGQAWTALSGTWSTVAASATETTSGSETIAVVDSGLANAVITCDIAAAPTLSQWGLALRATDNTHYLVTDSTSLQKNNGGTYTTLITFSGGANAVGDTLTVTLSGSSISVSRTRAGVTTAQGSATDAFNSTATKHGLRSGGVASGNWSHFTVT